MTLHAIDFVVPNVGPVSHFMIEIKKNNNMQQSMRPVGSIKNTGIVFRLNIDKRLSIDYNIAFHNSTGGCTFSIVYMISEKNTALKIHIYNNVGIK